MPYSPATGTMIFLDYGIVSATLCPDEGSGFRGAKMGYHRPEVASIFQGGMSTL